MPHRRDHNARLLNFARTMRKNATDPERRLWSILRNRQLSGFKFRRQVPIAGYIADFFCDEASLIVEVDGDQHGNPVQERYDQARTSKLAELNIQVLRIPAFEIMRDLDAVAATIDRELPQHPPRTLTPTLSRKRERE